MLYGPKGCGKSMLARFIGFSVVDAGQRSQCVLHEQVWRAIQSKKPERNKVLYFAFEQDDRVVKKNNEIGEKLFGENKWNKVSANYIVEGQMHGKDYFADENFHELEKRILKAKDESKMEHPVDLVVIDTVLVGAGDSTKSLEAGIRKLRDFARIHNFAVLLIHHSNAEGGVEKGEAMLKNVDLTIRIANCTVEQLEQNGMKNLPSVQGQTDLKKPFALIRTKSNDKSYWAEEKFNICFRDGDGKTKPGFYVCSSESPEQHENSMLYRVYKAYKEDGYTQEQISEMLGTSPNTLKRNLKKAKEALKENNIKKTK